MRMNHRLRFKITPLLFDRGENICHLLTAINISLSVHPTRVLGPHNLIIFLSPKTLCSSTFLSSSPSKNHSSFNTSLIRRGCNQQDGRSRIRMENSRISSIFKRRR
ncbi:hypothetical protein L1987_12864 [Smallanthus sonchifolius]|uniref:Uncharacterized protein n=1 Tax=Smallanthus sonchifolius TaxID=185202 RepID=A0ACB9JIF5_9ASTR|nr:hypothetical protein L1987_12864 [Smallanthus sonchifolius]